MNHPRITEAQYLADRQALLDLVAVACALRSRNLELLLLISQAQVLIQMMDTRMQQQRLRGLEISRRSSSPESDAEMPELEFPESDPESRDSGAREGQ